jgi:antitoxin YqcF
MTPSATAKLAFNELVRTWGCRPTVFKHADESEQNFVFVAHLDNSPVEGITAVATLGLSDHDLGLGPVRVELLGSFPTAFREGPNVAATCAFNAFNDGLPLRPEAIHPSVLSIYRTAPALPHVMMVDPFLWDNGPETLDGVNGFKVAWLMMVPISESERLFAIENGGAALTERFQQRQIDLFDLNRNVVA